MLLSFCLWALLAGPAFRLEVITVRGNEILGRETILDAAGLRTGVNLFRVNLRAVRQGLLALPRVQSADVTRVWPNGLDLFIRERSGLALIPCGQGWVEAAADGTALELHPSSAGLGLVTLEGIEPATVGIGEMIPGAAARMALGGLADLIAAGERPASARLGAAGLEVCLADGTLLYLGPADAGLGTRVAAAARIAADLRSRGIAVVYIDVRLPGQPVIKPR